MATILPFPHRTPDLSWRPAVAARVEAWRLRRRIVRAARALVAIDGADEAVLLALQERGLATKHRRAWVATPAGAAAVVRKPRVPLFVARAD